MNIILYEKRIQTYLEIIESCDGIIAKTKNSNDRISKKRRYVGIFVSTLYEEISK